MDRTSVLDNPGSSGPDGALGITREICVPNPESPRKTAREGETGHTTKRAEKSLSGLPRASWVPRGVDLGKLDKSDLAVYRRALRWQRLRAVQEWLLPNELVAKCFRTRYKPAVEVQRSRSVGRAHYGALVTCGSVWMCPICAAKITERRRAELEAANTSGLSKFMVTFTMQHARGDKLAALVRDLSEGLRAFKAGRWWQGFAKDLQIAGSVMGTEITVSASFGFHPHKHALYFSRLKQCDLDAGELREEISRRFETVMFKRSRYVSPVFGVDVRADENVQAAYVAKMGEGEKESSWTLAAELTKSPMKSGRDAEHYHPFELPDLYLSGNRYAGKLFREYAHAMKGRKQLFYAPGTRDLLGLGAEMSDEEIASAQEKDAYLFAMLSPDDWRLILQREKRGQVLEVASTGDYQAFVNYMRAIGAHDFGKESG